jgi:glycosyltransferase involved in cell wall biosynthesis
MRVCFVARPDVRSKPGGDTVQIDMYSSVLRRAGGEPIESHGHAPLPDADIYHCLNIDRPLEIYPQMRAVAARNKPFIISTIHHPHAWVRRFRRSSPPGGLTGQLLYRGPLGRSIALAEWLKEPIRVHQQRGRILDYHLWKSWNARARWLLREARQVMLLSAAEQTAIEKDFSVRIGERARVVPNWVESVAAETAGHVDLCESEILVVGRVEARKNSLGVLRVMERESVRGLFIGRANPNEQAYTRAFASAVAASRLVRWIPGVPRSELFSYYRCSQLVVNASFVEVSPLVDLEAIAAGVPLVTTTYALHHEFLSSVPAVDPYDADNIARSIQAAHRGLGSRLRVDLARTAPAALLASYRACS